MYVEEVAQYLKCIYSENESLETESEVDIGEMTQNLRHFTMDSPSEGTPLYWIGSCLDSVAAGKTIRLTHEDLWAFKMQFSQNLGDVLDELNMTFCIVTMCFAHTGETNIFNWKAPSTYFVPRSTLLSEDLARTTVGSIRAVCLKKVEDRWWLLDSTEMLPFTYPHYACTLPLNWNIFSGCAEIRVTHYKFNKCCDQDKDREEFSYREERTIFKELITKLQSSQSQVSVTSSENSSNSQRESQTCRPRLLLCPNREDILFGKGFGRNWKAIYRMVMMFNRPKAQSRIYMKAFMAMVIDSIASYNQERKRQGLVPIA